MNRILTSILDFPWERPALAFFLLTLPFSTRNVIKMVPPGSLFNEYRDISVYISDISLGIFLFSIILRYSYKNKSIVSKSIFHVEQLLWPLPFILWAGSTYFWAASPLLSIYTFFKLLEGYLLYVGILLVFSLYQKQLFHVEQFLSLKNSNVPRGTLVSQPETLGAKMFHVEHWLGSLKLLGQRCSTWNIWDWIFLPLIASGAFQAFLALLQFCFQKSLGLTWLGESNLNSALPGVAEVILGGGVFIRAYGTFLHPNVLGCFLGLTILITLAYPLVIPKKMFHVEHSFIQLILKIALALQFLGLITTFSKSAFMGVCIGLAYFFFSVPKMFHVEQSKPTLQNVPRGTWISLKLSFLRNMFHVEHIFIVLFTILFITAYFQWINTYYFFYQPFIERTYLLQALTSFHLAELLFGVGLGQFVLLLPEHFPGGLLVWQIQPIHNIPFLLMAEIGFIGLSLFLLFLSILGKRFFMCFKMFHVEQKKLSGKNVLRGTWGIFISAIFLILAIPFLTDHFFWDIQQGILLFWLVLGLGAWSTIDKNY